VGTSCKDKKIHKNVLSSSFKANLKGGSEENI
jgi:hypothetical protein